MKQKQTFKPVSVLGIFFKHSLGWTYIQTATSDYHAQMLLQEWRDKLPSFTYRAIPVLITPILPSKPRRTPKKPITSKK